MKKPAPFPAFAAPLVRIEARPIARGFRYQIRPQGRAAVTAYSLIRAREVARRFSRRVLELGPAKAFNHRVQR
jgi:hypothetical protein